MATYELNESEAEMIDFHRMSAQEKSEFVERQTAASIAQLPHEVVVQMQESDAMLSAMSAVEREAFLSAKGLLAQAGSFLTVFDGKSYSDLATFLTDEEKAMLAAFRVFLPPVEG